MSMTLNNPVLAFLKLIRVENLLIILLTQYGIYYGVISVFLRQAGLEPRLSPLLFFLIVLSTVLIAAAGYIINDYFDVKTDRINRPDTVVIDRYIKRRWAMVLHVIFNVVGLLLAAAVAYKSHNLKLVLLQLIAGGLLWFYSTDFKKQLLVGNFVVSLLTATIPVMPLLYELSAISAFDRPIRSVFMQPDFSILVKYVGSFSLFAFLTSMAREIIKDMEDFKGDVETGCKTMPIAWGMIASKVFAGFVIFITMSLLGYICFKLFYYQNITAIVYIVAVIILPLALLLIWLIRANTARQFKSASLLLKFIMLTGISFSVIIYKQAI